MYLMFIFIYSDSPLGSIVHSRAFLQIVSDCRHVSGMEPFFFFGCDSGGGAGGGGDRLSADGGGGYIWLSEKKRQVHISFGICCYR